MSERLWIAFAGLPKCGETTASRHVFYKDFFTVNRSTILEDQANKVGYELHEPKSYEEFEHLLREQHGVSAIADIAIAEYMLRDRIVFQGGIYNCSDADTFKKAGGTIVVIWCPFVVRFTRAQQEALETEDKLTAKLFQEREANRYDSPDKFGCQIIRVMQEADYHIYGDRTRSEVLHQVLSVVESLEAASA